MTWERWDWVYFFQNMELGQAVVNVVMELSVPQSEGNSNVFNTCVHKLFKKDYTSWIT